MPYSATVFNVMIASPSDVQLEKSIARDVIHEWNAVHSLKQKVILHPIAWETHSAPSMDERPQAVINKQVLKNSDLLVAIFWTRLGTPTGEADSGTVEEIEKHIKAGKPAMIYFSSAPVRLESVDEHQYKALITFKEECKKKGLIETFEDDIDFRIKFARQLATTLNSHEYFKKYSVESEPDFIARIEEQPKIPDLSREAVELLVEAIQDPHGIILYRERIGGTFLSTHDKQFIESGNPRSLAVWQNAVKQLVVNNLIQDTGHQGEVYRLTQLGYEVGDILKSR